MFRAIKLVSAISVISLSVYWFLICPNWQAQVSSGSIVGFVTDPTGAVIPDAKVSATNIGTNRTDEKLTDAQGYYEFPFLLGGRYKMSIEKQGFQRATSAEFTLHSGTRPRLDFQLQLGEITETVEVISSAPLVNATTTDLGVTIESQKIRQLPLNGRDFKDMIVLQPGWNIGGDTGNRGGAELNGSPGLANNFLMDGVDMSFGETNGVGLRAAGASGTRINTVSVEALEEFKTTSGAFSAEFGHSTGAVVNLVTKSGTNNFHGTLFEFLRNDKLDANSFFGNRSGLKRPTLRFNQYGANLGGPIWRDKIFFFFNYEGVKVRQERIISGNVPTPLLLSRVTNPALRADLAKLPSSFEPTNNPLLGLHRRNDKAIDDELTTLSRVDANFGKHRLGFRLAYNEQNASNPQLREDIRQVLPVPVRNWTVSDYITISPTIQNEIRFGYNHYPVSRHTESEDPAANDPAHDNFPTLIKERRALRAPGLTFFTFDLTQLDTPTQTFLDNLSWIRGAHTFKAGVEVRRSNGNRLQYGQGAWHNYNTLDDMIIDKTFSLELDFGNPGKGFKFWTYAGYFQDEWKVNRRLQLNLGLRYEYYTVLKGPIGFRNSNPYGPLTNLGDPLFAPDRNNFGPRGGLVFDVLGNGKTILRAGAGISYIPIQPLSLYDSAWLGTEVPAFPTVNVIDLPPSLLPVVYPFPDEYLQAVRDDPTKAPEGLSAGRRAADPGRRDEYSEMWNLSLQHQLTSTLAVQGSYVGNRVLKQFTSRQENLINPATGQRPVPEMGQIVYQENAGTSWYHALQLSLNKRLSHGLTIDAHYTWAKLLEYHGASVFGDYFTQDFQNIGGSVGPRQGFVPQRFVLVHSYEVPTVPFARQSALGRALLGGWTAQGVLGARGGSALNILLGVDAVGNNYGSTQRPDAVPGVSPYLKGTDRLSYLNRAAYDAAGPTLQKRFGNLGYNTALGPGGFTWDIGIHKVFVVHEQHRITFRLEMFNWLNHVVFGNPSTTVSAPNFGVITGGSDGRNIQLGLKYTF